MEEHKPNLLTVLPDWLNISGVKQACDDTVPRWWRLGWLAVVLTGIAFPLYQIFTQVAHYLDRPVTVRLTMESKVQKHFPPITFCNLNIARRSKLDEWNLTFMTPYFDVKMARNYNRIDPEEMAALEGYNWPVVYKDVAHRLEEMLYICNWKGRNCTADDFSISFTAGGVCFTFNRERTKTVQVAGRGGALRMILNVQQEEYLPRSLLAGVEVMLEEFDSPPQLTDQSINVPVGSWTSIVMHKKMVTRVEPPWEDCVPVGPDSTYQGRETCMFDCYAQEVIRNCTCRMPYMPQNITVRICNPLEIYWCALPTFFDIQEGYNECAAKCNDEMCVQEAYETMTNEATFSSVFLEAQSKKDNISRQEVRENFVGFEVFFRDMQEEHINNTIAYTGIDLFCDIGGAMGLILGASLATVVEFIDIVLFRDRLRAWKKSSS